MLISWQHENTDSVHQSPLLELWSLDMIKHSKSVVPGMVDNES